jgi:hypothetical protein
MVAVGQRTVAGLQMPMMEQSYFSLFGARSIRHPTVFTLQRE